MTVIRSNAHGDPSVGLYGFATEKLAIFGHLQGKLENELKTALHVDIVNTTIAGTNLAGIFSAGNSNGIIVPEIAYKNEVKNIEKRTDVLVLKSKYTALGNLILVNDGGCLISEKLEKHKKSLEDLFKVEVETSKIAGLDLVGSLAVCNNRGCVVSKDIKKGEKEILERVLKVKAEAATVNFGSSFLKSAIIANSGSLIVGDQTSGPELERISSILCFD